MPWGEKTVEHKRNEFVAEAVAKEKNISELCREYGITRKTGYKWLERYRQGESLTDRSHAPVTRPWRTPPEMEKTVIMERNKHPTWGARKLVRSLENKGYTNLPAPSTVCSMLKRRGLVDPDESEKHTPYIRFEQKKPNDLWQMDFKGDFSMLDGKRCHPLTLLDDNTRYLLCLDAQENERYSGVKDSLLRLFHEYGLPRSILCDNGAPWKSLFDGYTPFEVWMMQLDVLPIHGRPYHPQTQGKDERFHRTLKEDLIKRVPISDCHHAQSEFDQFRYCYNYERPHAAINLDVPAKRYRKSNRPLPEKAGEPEYDAGRILRKVNCKGYLSIQRHRYYISESFINKYVELVYTGNDLVDVCYGSFRIARIDIKEQIFNSKKIYTRDYTF
jgi:transposase InsO family protein